MKTLTADDKYSLRNSENLPQPIQMQLFKNLKIFAEHFTQFLEYTSNFKHSGKEDDPRSVCTLEVTDCERHG